MNLQLDPQDEAFREEVRAYLRTTLPEDVRHRTLSGMHPPHEEDRRWWQKKLHAKGWVAPHWPKEYGGTGWSPLRTHIFEQECRLADAPELRWQGLRLFGPVLYTFGSPEQKVRYLPKILSGEEQWAQGFSEPNAGSDLASLRSTAVLDGDHWVINGQKAWTSEGQYAEQGFFLVRTSNEGKPQRGISMMIVDMQTPGVSVHETQLLHGAPAVCEVFLDNVRVPKNNLVGALNSGWQQARFLLDNERTSSAEIHKARADLKRIKTIASAERRNGRPVIEDPIFARKLAMAELDIEALEWSVLRVLCEAPSLHPTGADASVLKIRGSELQQLLAELAVEALGIRGLRQYSREQGFSATGDSVWPHHTVGPTVDLLYLRACTIFGGAKEIQKNIIAKLAFGL